MAAHFGVRLPVNGPLAGPDAVGRIARLAEDLGYDAVWVHDLLGWTTEQQKSVVYCGSVESSIGDPNMFEPLITLAHVSGLTSGVRLGTSIIALPLRNAILLARQLASLDVLSGGRLIAGVGVGSTGDEVSAYEIAGTPRARRYERMGEYLEVLERAWYSDWVEYHGRHIQLPPTQLQPSPTQQPLPVWFGGSGDRTLGLLARHGHGWLPSWADIGTYRLRLARLSEMLEAQGRHLQDVVVGKDCYIAVDEDGEHARRSSDATVELLLQRLSGEARNRRATSMLIGSPEEIVEQIAEYQTVGVTDFEMKFIYRDLAHLEHQMRLFAQTIIPTIDPLS